MMVRMATAARKKLEDFKAVTVKHPRLEEVDRQVSQAIMEKAGFAHLLVYGPSGVGKSTMIHRVTDRFRAEEPHREVVPMVFVEARPSDTGSYLRLDYYRQVLTALKEHVVVKEILVNINAPTKPTRSRSATDWLEMRDAVEQALERLQVRAVVIDEAQHVMQVEDGHKAIEQLDWLKSMTNRTNVLHILVGPYDLCDFRNLSGQAARRGRDVHFPRYHFDVVAERMEFAGALRYLLERVPLGCDVNDLLNHWRWFGEASLGCVGILKDWLVQTVAAALADGETALTLDALETYALASGPRVRLELEARAGEHKVEMESAQSQQQLQTLLGTAATDSTPSFTAPDPTPKGRRGRRPGTRLPTRDLAGDGSA